MNRVNKILQGFIGDADEDPHHLSISSKNVGALSVNGRGEADGHSPGHPIPASTRHDVQVLPTGYIEGNMEFQYPTDDDDDEINFMLSDDSKAIVTKLWKDYALDSAIESATWGLTIEQDRETKRREDAIEAFRATLSTHKAKINELVDS